MTTEIFAMLKPWLLRWESWVTWWYRDEAKDKQGNLLGVMTIGAGFAYWHELQAAELGPGAVEAYREVQAMPPGKLADFYKVVPWRADETKLAAEFYRRIGEFWAALEAIFPDFNDWPSAAQIGAFDLAWGAGESLSGWPHFRAACLAHNWAEAAQQCLYTKGTWVQARQDERQQLFLSLVTTNPTAGV